MKKYITLVLLALALVACDKKSEDGTTEEPTADEATKEAPDDEAEEPAEETEQPTDEKAATVEVATDGTKFEPAIAANRLPDGAWYCNMGGSVHYARMEEGDGKCAVCGMKLEKYAAGAADDGHMMDDEQMGDGHMGDGDEMHEEAKDEPAE